MPASMEGELENRMGALPDVGESQKEPRVVQCDCSGAPLNTVLSSICTRFAPSPFLEATSAHRMRPPPLACLTVEGRYRPFIARLIGAYSIA